MWNLAMREGGDSGRRDAELSGMWLPVEWRRVRLGRLRLRARLSAAAVAAWTEFRKGCLIARAFRGAVVVEAPARSSTSTVARRPYSMAERRGGRPPFSSAL